MSLPGLTSGWRYRRLAPRLPSATANCSPIQIAPHIGQRPLQKLKSADIEVWHATLKTVGRKHGQGGLGNRTIRHAHRLLSKALKEGVRHDLIVRNVAVAEQPPKAEDEEIVVLDFERVKE